MKWYISVLKKYATFEGRATRSEFWYFTLFSALFSIILQVIGLAVNFPFLNTVYSLAVLLPSIAVAVRRMHDVGKNGWYCIIPIYNLVLACTDGTVGTNEYGSDPKRPEYEEFLATPVTN